MRSRSKNSRLSLVDAAPFDRRKKKKTMSTPMHSVYASACFWSSSLSCWCLCIRRPGTEGMAASPPDYFVAIDAVSGLDPSTDLGRPALDPAFSLTVRVASRSSAHGACVRAGTSVLVSYRGVPLAGGRAPADPELCAGPMGAAEDGSVVARGSGVRVPGPQLDALAEDMRRGEALFEVTLAMPYYGQRKVASCWDRVGDAAALRVPCDVSLVDPRRLAGITGFSDLPSAM